MKQGQQSILFNRFVWFVVYFGLILVKAWHVDWRGVAWVLGGLGAFIFDVVDRLVYVYVTRPHEQLSLQVQHIFSQGRVRDALRLLYQRSSEQLHLSSRSVLFLVAWIPLAFFVISSTTSWLAKGLVMGLGLKMVRDIVFYWSTPQVLAQEYLWQVKRVLSAKEIRVMGGVFVGIFLVLSLMI